MYFTGIVICISINFGPNFRLQIYLSLSHSSFTCLSCLGSFALDSLVWTIEFISVFLQTFSAAASVGVFFRGRSIFLRAAWPLRSVGWVVWISICFGLVGLDFHFLVWISILLVWLVAINRDKHTIPLQNTQCVKKCKL